jgi:hypothetical protein
LKGLRPSELHFETIPKEADTQIDFLMMNCHNPAVALEGRFEGHGVWADRVGKDMSERRLHLS